MVTEDKLPHCLEEGWEIEHVLNSKIERRQDHLCSRQKRREAKQTLLHEAIGLLIVRLARVITNPELAKRQRAI